MSHFDVIGLGSLVLDRLHRANRILGPDEKGPLVADARAPSSQTRVGGVMLNQLGWASALGLRTAILGRVAEDAAGRELRAAMNRAGIEARLRLDARSSAVAEIFVDAGGERAIYYDSGGTGELDVGFVREVVPEALERASRFSTEVHQVPLPAVRAALHLARDAGVPTTLDVDEPPSSAVPHLGDRDDLEEVLGLADLLKPSLRAARELVPGAGDDALALACAMRERWGCEAVVVTHGAAGCAIATPGAQFELPAYVAKAVDATGAGDAFLGGLLAGIHQGLRWEDAARLANACGAVCVEQWGAFPEDPAAMRARVLDRYDGASFKPAPLAAEGRAQAALASAYSVFDATLDGVASLRERFASATWGALISAVDDALRGGARVHVTGVGKPEHLARYGASLLASTGVPAAFLHATETVHGSAGQIVAGDLVIAISNSGTTRELLAAVDAVRALGARVVAVTADPASPLADRADWVLDAAVAREGGGLGLAPRASAAAELVVLAALSAGLETLRNLTHEDYHARHPAGRLGQLSKRA